MIINVWAFHYTVDAKDLLIASLEIIVTLVDVYLQGKKEILVIHMKHVVVLVFVHMEILVLHLVYVQRY